MADEHQEIRNINWREVFPFTHLFRGFRMAVDPKKLLLLFAALTATWGVGKGLDLVFGRRVPVMYSRVDSLPAAPKEAKDQANQLFSPGGISASVSPDPVGLGGGGEGREGRGGRGRGRGRAAAASDPGVAPNIFVAFVSPRPPAPGQPPAQAEGTDVYDKMKEEAGKDRERYLAKWMIYLKIVERSDSVPDPVKAAEERVKTNGIRAGANDIEEKIDSLYKQAQENANTRIEAGEKEVERLKKALADVAAEPKDSFESRKKAAEDSLKAGEKDLQSMKDWKNFELADHYDRVIRHLNLVRGERISVAFWDQIARSFNTCVSSVVDFSPSAAWWSIKSIFLTLVWIVHDHPFFALIYLPLVLVLFSFFGGAAARVAAVQFARDEKISFKEALKFSMKKKISFIVSPLIPLLIVGVIALITALVALLINIPWAGEILAAVPFFLALLGGFIMALVVVGTVAGFPLMHPTIAVEGSDAFDAISRSFSYVYSRPWTAGFYAAVALAYGAIAYMFVRFFVWLLLFLTHASISMGVFAKRPVDQPEDSKIIQSKFEIMWASPSYDNLFDTHLEYAYNPTEKFASCIIGLWVYLVLFLMAAFVLSYLYSQATIIYYLLRNQVDATELDDVYLEEPEEEFTEMTSPAPAAPTKPSDPPAPKIELPMASATPSSPTPAPAPAPAPEAPKEEPLQVSMPPADAPAPPPAPSADASPSSDAPPPAPSADAPKPEGTD